MADGTLEDELMRSSDDFMRDLERLRELEVQKRGMTAGDPARSEVAALIEDVTLGLLSRSQYQTRLAIASESTEGRERRAIALVLQDWRDPGRRMREAHQALRGVAAQSAAYRDEYLRTLDELERSSGN